MTQKNQPDAVELLYATLESSFDHIVLLDQQGCILMVNNSWQNFAFDNNARMEKDDWTGMDYLSICAAATPPFDEGAREVYQGLSSILQKEQDLFEYEYACHSPTEERWFLLRAVPLRSKNGGILVSHTNITDVKKAHRELNIAASAFQAVDAITITDADANIQRVNNAFTQITGFTEQEVIGKNPNILKSGLHNSDFYHKMWARINESGRWEGELWNRRKNGEIYPEYCRIQAVKNELNQVENYIASFSDISKQKKAEKKAHKLTFYDPLTKLPNKNLTTELLNQALTKSISENTLQGLMLLKINNLNLINKSLGHQYGDEALVQITQRLKKLLKPSDLVSRFTGVNFAILISSQSDHLDSLNLKISETCQKVLKSIEAPMQIGKSIFHLNASIGIDIFPLHKIDSVYDIYQRAENAKQRAKDTPDQNFIFFKSEMQRESKQKLALLSELSTALINEEYLLHYQKQVNHLADISGYEALIRWQHPNHGLLLPGYFIKTAENSDQILSIGKWVLKTACQQIKRIHQLPVKPITISVNICPRQFCQKDFVSSVKHIVRESGVDPAGLRLEITENVAMINIREAIEKMNILRNEGISWALDDFGSGFSSLSYLKDLPFDILKIDRSFINNCHTNKKNQAIIKAIISMAHNLDLKVIAEGTERLEEINFLKSIDCDFFQGFYYGKPSEFLNPELDKILSHTLS